MRTVSQLRTRLGATAIMAVAVMALASVNADAADVGVKGNPPYKWAHVATKADADAVKPGDSIAMVCAKCKTVFRSRS